MFEYLGYVNIWTEFLVSIGALSHFVEDYDDVALLSNVWRKSALETFSLAYFDSERALSCTPRPLVDWYALTPWM